MGIQPFNVTDGGIRLTHPEEDEREVEEFETVDAEAEPEAEPVEEFETVEEEEPKAESEEEAEAEPEEVAEFDGFDENASGEIPSSGFQTTEGEIPGYEPTVDEVIQYALGKSEDPSEPVEKEEPGSVSDSLSSILTKSQGIFDDDESTETEDDDVGDLLDELEAIDEGEGETASPEAEAEVEPEAEPEVEPEPEPEAEPVDTEESDEEHGLEEDELAEIFDDEEKE
jgi:hypothetical protein